MDTPSSGSVSAVESKTAQAVAAPTTAPATAAAAEPARVGLSAAHTAHSPGRRKLIIGLAVAGALLLLFWLLPIVRTALNTESTDDAYVNGHVTFVAPRVAGQVSRVLVDDNMRVKKGDLLVALDEEPLRVQVEIKQAAVTAAETESAAALARTHAAVGRARASRFKLDHAIEDVKNQLAVLESNVAQLKVAQANLVLAQQNFARSEQLVKKGAVSQQDFDVDRASLDAAQNRVSSAEQVVQQTRVSLGLPINKESPLDIPPNFDQNVSTVREAFGAMLQNISELGYTPSSWNITPQQAIEDFYKQDPDRNLDRIYAKLIANAPAVKVAEAQLLQARRDLEQAQLNLRYCKIISDIDGVVTRRNVNPGNYVQVGQALMAVRSLTEIWIDANFKETQLAHLRIGQRVEIDTDIYGSRQKYEGRISGFTMGTGSTLALLPPQNATGNFVKVVQRLPVRIELTNYDPDKAPLFVGLSVVPYVYFKEPPTGPHAGAVLQPLAPAAATENAAAEPTLPTAAAAEKAAPDPATGAPAAPAAGKTP